MAGKRGIAGAERLARRAQTGGARGGQDRHADGLDRSATDACAWWRDVYLEWLRSRNYAAQTVETVLMGYPGRHTACVSTQAGCAMGCVFCATGQMGFVRHLTPG